MRILREGDTGKAVCTTCEELVGVRYEYRTVHLEKTRVDVESVLVGACYVCASTVTIPAQSSPRLKEARERQLAVFNARVPQHLEDILHLIADRFEVPYSSFCSALLRYYLRLVKVDDGFARRVMRLARSKLAVGRSNARLSLRVDQAVLDLAWEHAREVGVRTQTDMFKGIIVAAKEDVIDGRAKARQRELEGIAAAS